ncbi:heptaprenyl diphosphate synthase component II [Sutcliffiella rhizosphaerae]|uniref:Heptaprenyl diphosphate synthase component 2 n=1 Tax=Sutcliffiella rhizosphaerae TaxID=2880967 RepID=A0ABM8YUE0_9BACI|nr:heptaprenyl diphosphate synthase component II [Sutcliffiella rhizosphaerae]CAG9623611.1 Heptaprenyl diphosphate synthase component 2 [Sutcliffiella rhizosphaerae]
MKLKMMYSFLNNDIQIIEDELVATIQSERELLQEASLHLLQAGGKRIRPVFVLLAAKFGDYNIQKIKNVAVALELIHMASLVHDDVIDDAELRRGKPTIKSKWNNRIAMYTGDYIFARSLELMTSVENIHAHRILSRTIVELCRGEIEQIRDKYNFDQNLRTYLLRIKRKTAILIAVSCQLGAISANVPEHIHKSLYWFGYYVGMSFQITDDILDFTSTEKELGKPAGSDLLQGNITLPVLFAMENPVINSKIRQISEQSTPDDIQYLIKEIKESDAITRSFALSDRYLQKAFKELDKLPNGIAKKTFNNVAKYIGKRKY